MNQMMREQREGESELEYLRAKQELWGIWQAEMMEVNAELRAETHRQSERIEALEFHLIKCRDSAYLMVTATAGVILQDFSEEKAAPKTRKKKLAK